MEAKISLIIPFYNSEITLRRAIISVLSQDFSNWELILVDDGSNDHSIEIAHSFLHDSRIKYIYQKNQGVSAARNLGASYANGNWLIFLDSDDELRLGFLQRVIFELKETSNIDYLLFGIRRINNGKEIESIPNSGKYFSKIPGTFVIRKSVFDQINGYDPLFKFSENTELFHRFDLINVQGKNIPFLSLNYFDNSLGGSKNLKNTVESLSLFLEKHSQTLTPYVKHLYHQIIGVILIRFRNFSEARKHLWKAVKYQPKKLATWGRLCLAFFPFLAKRFYSETVNHA